MGLPRPARAPPPNDATPEAGASPARPQDGETQNGPPPSGFHVAAGKRRKVGPDDDERKSQAPGRFPASAFVRVIVIGGLGFALGWAVAWNGWFPGVFLASDIGLPATLIALLASIRSGLRAVIPDDKYGRSTAAIARAASAAIVTHWSVSSITNVPQLAIGLGLGILLFQLYSTRSQLAASGRLGFGPGLPLSAAVIVAYIVWLLLRRLIGALPGFDIATGAAVLVFSILVLSRTRAMARAAAKGRPSGTESPAATKRRQGEQRIVVALILAYLVFRFFISAAIPYGPIVEWFLVCIGVLFFAIIAADRIGTVPTRRSLPQPDRRTHVQRVVSLPDVRLADAEARLGVFIKTGRGAAWLHEHFTRVYKEAGIADAESARLLAALAAPEGKRASDLARMDAEERGRLVSGLVDFVRARRSPTGTLKAAPVVRAPVRSAAAPS